MSDTPSDHDEWLAREVEGPGSMATAVEASVNTLLRVSAAMGASADDALGRVGVDRRIANRRQASAATSGSEMTGAVRRLGKAAPNVLRVLALLIEEIERERRRPR